MKKVTYSLLVMAAALLLSFGSSAHAVPGNGQANGYGGQGNGHHYGHTTNPEPISSALFLLGGAGLVAYVVRKKKTK
jgi:hypothetical protein